MAVIQSPKRDAQVKGKPPRAGVCPRCWGFSFHRDGCPHDDGKPRAEARRA
jgi:hypothetical protein